MTSILKIDMYLYGKMALLRLTPVVYYISLNYNKLLRFNILKHMDCNHKIWGSPCIKSGTIYSNGGHIGFNYTNTSLTKYAGLKITVYNKLFWFINLFIIF